MIAPQGAGSSPLALSIDQIKESYRRELYFNNPTRWVNERLGEFVWKKQYKILESLRDNRRTAVHSCHRVGKSWLGGRIAFWWLDTHPPGEALVITSAHSSAQVKMALWREMGRVHAKGQFPGRMNQVEYWMPMPNGTEEMVAFGRKPADNDPGAFQGTYSKYVLFILDEACYVPETLWDGAETLIGNEFSRIIAFGNPDDPNTEFARVCKPGSGWNVIKIAYTDTPNFTNEQVPQSVKDMLIGPTWVEEKRKKWGESNPLFISKVLGEFPETSTDGLIPMQWIRAAQERDLSHETGPSELGVDVGGGGDKNKIAHRRGGWVRIVGGDQNPDTMQTLSNVLDALKETNATKAKVDKIGIGWGAVNRAEEMSKDQSVIQESPDLARRAGLVEGVMVSQSAQDKEQFVNLRAEGCWALRERFREGTIDIDPDDDDLASQLANIRYKRSAGRIQIESKEEMKRRGMRSPDDFEAVMLAFLRAPVVVEEEIVYEVSWG